MRLKQIDWKNLSDVSALRPKKSQEAYLPSVDYFLAEAYVNVSLGYPDVCRAIYADDKLVGFTKIVYVPENEKPYDFKHDACMIDCLLIDRDYQNQGYGTAALKLVLTYINDQLDWRYEGVRLTCHKNNIRAIRFFNHHGFKQIDVTLEGRKHLWLFELSNQR